MRKYSYIIYLIVIIVLIGFNITVYKDIKVLSDDILDDEKIISTLSESIDSNDEVITSLQDQISNFDDPDYDKLKNYEKQIEKLYDDRYMKKTTIENLNSDISDIGNDINNYCTKTIFTDVRQVFKYLDYTKSEIFKEFGKTNPVDGYEGIPFYVYDGIGLTFTFDEYYGVEYNTIWLHHKIDIDGVSPRMNLDDIKYYFEHELGKKVEINEPDYNYDSIRYEIDEYLIIFYAAEKRYSNAILRRNPNR